jgi:2-methylisocitrate lyase-like PEP mutase family enzyme
MTDASRAEVIDEVVRRGQAFLEVGAPVVFVPGRLTGEQVAALVEALGPQRLSVLPVGGPSLARLEELGVARASFGPFPQRVALTALQQMVEGVARGDGIPQGTRPLT